METFVYVFFSFACNSEVGRGEVGIWQSCKHTYTTHTLTHSDFHYIVEIEYGKGANTDLCTLSAWRYTTLPQHYRSYGQFDLVKKENKKHLFELDIDYYKALQNRWEKSK